MKTPEQKARIREMLRADAGEENPQWRKFTAFLKTQLAENETPPKLCYRNQQLSAWRFALPALAALLVVAVFIFTHYFTGRNGITPPPSEKLAGSNSTGTKKLLRKGELYATQGREIRLLRGEVVLQEKDNRIAIAAEELKATFRLRKKTDLKIEHPLIHVTVTGTVFTLAADRQQGALELIEGSLLVALRHPHKELALKAPARLAFNHKGYTLHAVKPSKDKILYRYDLANGESFFAYPVREEGGRHVVELLGGGRVRVNAGDLKAFGPVETP